MRDPLRHGPGWLIVFALLTLFPPRRCGMPCPWDPSDRCRTTVGHPGHEHRGRRETWRDWSTHHLKETSA